MQTTKTLIRIGGCLGWSESSLGAHAILLVLSWGGSNVSAGRQHYSVKLKKTSINQAASKFDELTTQCWNSLSRPAKRSTFFKLVYDTYSSKRLMSWQTIKKSYVLRGVGGSLCQNFLSVLYLPSQLWRIYTYQRKNHYCKTWGTHQGSKELLPASASRTVSFLNFMWVWAWPKGPYDYRTVINV